MYFKNIKVTAEEGLHARPASVFVAKANRYESQIKVKFGEKKENAKSIISMMSMGIKANSVIEISAIGSDQIEAVDGLVSLIEKNFKSE